MTDVVKQYCQLNGERFLVADVHTLGAKHSDGAFHKVEGTEHVTETAVHSSWIHQICESQLFYITLALKKRMRDNIEYQLVVNRQESIYRIVYYLAFVGQSLKV